MATIEVEILTEDAMEEDIYRAYWLLRDDGETWARTITELRTEYDLKQRELTRIVQECGTAVSPELTCPDCQWPFILKSRTHYAELSRTTASRCTACKQAIDEARVLAEQERDAQRRSALEDRYGVAQTSRDLEPEDLSLTQAIGLFTLMSDPAVEQTGRTAPTSQWPKDRPWAHPRLADTLERELVRSGTLRAHPESPIEAFSWEEEEPNGFYPTEVSYWFDGTGTTAKNANVLVNKLTKVFREGPWPEQWLSEWPDLWDRLVLADASVYLDMKLREHRLEMKQGDGTLTALTDALATYSLGQVYNFIYRATKDSAAYYQRGGVNIRQAANSTVGRITAAVGRARASKWDMKPYGRVWNLPLTAMGEVFFTTVMWLPDMMAVRRQDVAPPPHAWSDPVANDQSDEPSESDGIEDPPF
jgi:hypothetical protein